MELVFFSHGGIADDGGIPITECNMDPLGNEGSRRNKIELAILTMFKLKLRREILSSVQSLGSNIIETELIGGYH